MAKEKEKKNKHTLLRITGNDEGVGYSMGDTIELSEAIAVIMDHEINESKEAIPMMTATIMLAINLFIRKNPRNLSVMNKISNVAAEAAKGLTEEEAESGGIDVRDIMAMMKKDAGA